MRREQKQDADTQKILSDGEEVANLVKGRGWSIARQKFLDNVIAIGNILDIKGNDPVNVMTQLAARQIATEMVLGWINDVEGTAAQYTNHTEQMGEIIQNSFILRE